MFTNVFSGFDKTTENTSDKPASEAFSVALTRLQKTLQINQHLHFKPSVQKKGDITEKKQQRKPKASKPKQSHFQCLSSKGKEKLREAIFSVISGLSSVDEQPVLKD